MDDENNVIELMPFIHQVGGHSFMLSLDEATVCKALIPRELQFYQTLPAVVKKFTPTFHGVISVRTVHDSDGYLRFLARPPPNYRLQPPAKARVRFKRSGSIELLATDGVFLEDPLAEGGAGLNPWVLTCHKQHMNHCLREEGKDILKEETVEEEREFIVLENLVSMYSYPCILDLKMGTRQYGDTASLAKKQSKMVKVVSTTSAKLGLRVGGMQVFQTDTARFLCRNKFYGRTLSVASFQQTLVQFLHNGGRFRSDVLSVLIRKLEELVVVLSKIEAVRFYTSSLLLLYEGEDAGDIEEGCGGGKSPRLEKQDSLGCGGRRGSDSDLSRKSTGESLTPFDDAPSPRGETKRRTSSAANLDSCSTPSGVSSNSSSSSTIFEESVTRVRGRVDSFRGRSFSTKSDPGGGGCAKEPRVDVRMIDFAHSTHKELDDVVVYSGPDRGFLFGLETLIDMLKAIKTDYG